MKTAGDTIREYENIPMEGILRKDGSFFYVTVPKEFGEAVYKAIEEEGMQRPEDTPHISVFLKDETEGKSISEVGQKFQFEVDGIESCNPDDWDEMEKVWFVKCKSPQLEGLRKKHGLTPLIHGNHNFHITIAVKPAIKKVARELIRIAHELIR